MQRCMQQRTFLGRPLRNGYERRHNSDVLVAACVEYDDRLARFDLLLPEKDLERRDRGSRLGSGVDPFQPAKSLSCRLDQTLIDGNCEAA